MPQRLRNWYRRRQNESVGYVAVVYCDRHEIDLEAARTWVADGRPDNTAAALEAIDAEECPACRPRYLAGPAPQINHDSEGWLSCSCCNTSWRRENDGWAAKVDGGLAVVEGAEPIPAGAEIDSASFEVAPLDPVDGPEEVLAAEIEARAAAASDKFRLDDEVVSQLVESIGLAYHGRARVEAEVYWLLDGIGLDEEATDLWRSVASDTLDEVRLLFGGDVVRRRMVLPASRQITLQRSRFERLVSDALDGLPPEFGEKLQNVAVVVESRSERDTDRAVVLGLYEGVPITRRGANLGDARRPDRITIFQDTICDLCMSEDEVIERTRRTVIHEIGHHFALDDRRLHELGW